MKISRSHMVLIFIAAGMALITSESPAWAVFCLVVAAFMSEEA